jgi:hypothetical protein
MTPPKDALTYFIQRTDSRLEAMEAKLDSLAEFRTKSIVEARLVSLIISGICGFVSLIASGVITYLITIKISK